MTFGKLAAAAVALTLLSSCSAETTVGGDLQTEFDAETEAPRLGERTETEGDEPAPEPTATASSAPAPQQTAAPAPQPTAEPEPQAQVSLTVQIYSDTEGPSQFDPPRARIFSGSCISWTNVDSVPRSVVADDGSFDSGPIDPGADFIHCFEVAGNFNYHDGTRPYAVASVEVLQP